MAVKANCALDQSINEVSMCANIRGTIFKIIKLLGLSLLGGILGHALLDELIAHVVDLVSPSLRTEEIGEEEELQDPKHNKELQQDKQPQRAPPRHLAEAVSIKSDHGLDGVRNGHIYHFFLFYFFISFFSFI